MERDDLVNRFTYHAPTEGQPEIYETIRQNAFAFATRINELIPDCREKSLAITHLEEAVFWANAGLARS